MNNAYNDVLSDQKLKSRITSHEGLKQSAYVDSLGYLTIGVGRLIDARKGGKLSLDEINTLLMNDIQVSINSLSPYIWFNSLNTVRRGALVELVFNMGLPNLLGFKNMIGALEAFDYITAGKELLDSSWAKQVGFNRSNDIYYRLVNGTYQ